MHPMVQIASRPISPNHPLYRMYGFATSTPKLPWALSVNAHAVLVRLCRVKSPMRRCANVANPANNNASFWLAVANAHAVLTRLS